MCVNVVVATTLKGVQAEAARFVASRAIWQRHVEAMPRHVVEQGVRTTRPYPWLYSPFAKLVIYFCEQGMRSIRSVIVNDAMLPEENDLLQWEGSFTQAYLSSKEL